VNCDLMDNNDSKLLNWGPVDVLCQFFNWRSKRIQYISYCANYTKCAAKPRITMTWYDSHPAMSSQLPCKFHGQHLFHLLVFIGCSSGSNSGLGWASGFL
jgi:hypothetical protein